MLERIFRSGAQVKVLGVVLFENGLHLREIARRAGVSAPEAKRELDALAGIGLLLKERRGNQLLFTANKESSFFAEMRGLYLKTEGVFAKLKETLAKLKGVKYAFIFGSYAVGEEKGTSDVDLLVVGSIKHDALSNAIFGVQRQSKREINFIHWSEADLKEKIASESPFLRNVLKKKIVWIAGDRDGFAGVAKKAAD